MNHRIVYHKRADKAIFCGSTPYDPERGWKKTDEIILKPVWSCGPILPSSLIDLLEKTPEEVEEDDEQEIDYDQLINDDEETYSRAK